jgi:hypothetical protein
MRQKSGPAREPVQQVVKVRIPTIAPTHSDGSRPPIPIDRDQCGAERDGAVGCIG